MSDKNFRQPNEAETKELARKNVIAQIQGAIDFIGTLRKEITDPEAQKPYGHQMNRLIDAKRWVNYIALGQVQEEKSDQN